MQKVRPKWRLEPERIDHVVAALALLVLSALSILASLLHGLAIK